MELPEDLKYTKEHEWVRVDGDVCEIGVTDFAQSELGDIVFVELPEVGATLTADETFGVAESVKTVSDLYSPVSGEVTGINDELMDSPELVNKSPYDDGWMIQVEMSDQSELGNLMSAGEYKKLIGKG